MMWWYMHDGIGWGWMIFGWIWSIIFWGSIIFLIVWAIRKFTGGGRREEDDDPVKIARMRYARGEISREEYERILEDLKRRNI